ncbi:mannosyl transferase protein [Rutstroemia sp. NJR-2017a BVV2]|nr:mannosyl transferase protein [Rutstroemia sp. NJR-2017a BVV2]
MVDNVLRNCQAWAESVSDRVKTSEIGQQAVDNQRLLLYGVGLLSLTAWLIIRAVTILKTPRVARPGTPDLEKPASRNGKPQRPLGVWEPMQFTRPTAPPYPNWDVTKTKPNAYRPFRHGPYHITMGLRTMNWDEWIELDNQYMKFHDDKARRIIERGSRSCYTDPSAFDGAVELLEELCSYLPERYPTLYKRTAIHTSGDVPGYKQKLEKGMMNFFRRVQPNGPVQRNNYFIQVDDQLAWSSSIGPEDGAPGTVSWDTAENNKAVEHHWFRSERQTLRRLPRSGGVVFTIRTYFHPITEICEEPYVPGRLASAVRSWGDDVSKYKGKEKYGEVLLAYLDKKHKEQVEAGLDVENEDEVRAYPY